MNIKFITNREDHQTTIPRTDVTECQEYLRKIDLIGIDTENSGLFEYHAIPLLLQVGDDKQVFVIDRTSVNIDWLSEFKDKKFIGQNLKYDYKIIKVGSGIELRNLEDIMITEQILGMGSRRSNALDDIIERRLNTKATFTKEVRNEFIRANKGMVFYDRHIIYAADDIFYLPVIRGVQQSLIDKFEMRFLLEEIEYKLIPILADCELRGLNLNVEKWKENIINNTKKKYELELKLDEELANLREETECEEEDIRKNPLAKINGGKYSRKRNMMPEVVQGGLFGNDKIIKVKRKAVVNWGSPPQVKAILSNLGCDIPTHTGTGKETIGVEHVEKYIVDNPTAKGINLMKLLVEYSDVSQKIDAFGQGHIDMISPVTKKIHTIYRQASAVTGRFQSGDTKHGFINSQQIPKSNDYRHCFVATEGYEILTIDLSSAELIILGSLANDDKLLKLQAEDIHSYLANASYNNLLKDLRKSILARNSGILPHHVELVKDLLSGFEPEEKISFEQAKDILVDYVEHAVEIVISKKNFKWIRDRFKNVVYGLIYGATEKRVAELLSISDSWAKIVLNTLRVKIPKTFNYLDDVAKLATTKGYVILSNRVKARRWFTEVVNCLKYKMELSWGAKGTIEREAKNAGIQGTNAFIIKEAIVRIHNEYIIPKGLDAHLILQVHDELVYEYKKEYSEFFTKDVHYLLTDTAKRYLAEGVSMGAEPHVGDTWHK